MTRKTGVFAWTLALACTACSGDEGPNGVSRVPTDASANGGSGNGGEGNGGSGNGGASSNGGASGSVNGGSTGTAGAGGAAASGGAIGTGGIVGVGGTYVWPGPTPGEFEAPKLDVLFVVDNSRGMGDHQRALANTVADLLRAITNAATKVSDLHVGVITSSIGGQGGDLCVESTQEQADDHSQLLASRPRAANLGLTNGYITWAGGSAEAMITSMTDLVMAAGESGCGYEAPLESLYRFLVDPNPPAGVTTIPCPTNPAAQCATASGTDSTVLAQRAAFLRPDSELAVVLLTNEDDCSVLVRGQSYFAVESDIILPKAMPVCATNPNDPCCFSCASAVPSGCTLDPSCQPATGDPAMDKLNVRCFDQKRRFGFDFLYPIARYVNALSAPTLCTANPDLAGCTTAVQNPLFAGTRTPAMVHLLGIAGVPWQTIAKASSATTLEYKTAAELAAGWPVVYGNPAASPPVRPTDPLMVPSIEPRSGTTPGTGEALVPPSSGYLANSVNGHEFPNTLRDDLQYACIFPLPSPRDCTGTTNAPDCECMAGDNGQRPMCQAPDGSYGAVQHFAKAYPGTRHVGLIKGLAASGTLASVCPKNLTDPTRADYAYRPAMNAFLRELVK